jgi:nitroimidazol reductase NimA-like FMN-containing flavoprotein (pyridoxamine 5'-phosphate oxidase superfamily)
MRRVDRELSLDETIKVIENQEYGVLSTVGENGYPYGIPLNYAYIDGAIYIHGARSGHKIENFSFCEKVSFTVVGDTEVLPEKFGTNYESAICFGKISEAVDSEKEKALYSLIEKYYADYLAEGREYLAKMTKATRVFKISIESISGKAKRK